MITYVVGTFITLVVLILLFIKRIGKDKLKCSSTKDKAGLVILLITLTLAWPISLPFAIVFSING